MQKIAECYCGKKIATMEMDADGLVSVFGKVKNRRCVEAEVMEILTLPQILVMEVRDRRSLDVKPSDMLQGYIDEIWELAAEDELWFDFCLSSIMEMTES